MSNLEAVAPSQVASPTRPPASRAVGVARYLALAALIAALIAMALGGGDFRPVARYLAGFAGAYTHPHFPTAAPLLAAGPFVLVHAGAAAAAMIIGTTLMVGVKGRLMHRVLGWAWVSFMMVVAAASLFIHTLSPGRFSVIHLLSVWVLIAAPLGLVFARRHRVAAHGRMMTGLYFGALWIAGAFTFLPGRAMYAVIFG